MCDYFFDPDGPDFGFVDTQNDRTDEKQVDELRPILNIIGEEDNIFDEEA